MCFFTTGHCKIIKLFSETRDSSHGNQEATIFFSLLLLSFLYNIYEYGIFFVMVQAFIEPYMTRKNSYLYLSGRSIYRQKSCMVQELNTFWRSTQRHGTTSKERLSIISTHTPHTSQGTTSAHYYIRGALRTKNKNKKTTEIYITSAQRCPHSREGRGGKEVERVTTNIHVI